MHRKIIIGALLALTTSMAAQAQTNWTSQAPDQLNVADRKARYEAQCQYRKGCEDLPQVVLAKLSQQGVDGDLFTARIDATFNGVLDHNVGVVKMHDGRVFVVGDNLQQGPVLVTRNSYDLREIKPYGQ